MGGPSVRLRQPIAATIALIVVAGGLLFTYVATVGPGAGRFDAQLLSHNPNDDKDNCPDDGNAGRGNDDHGPPNPTPTPSPTATPRCKPHPVAPPKGRYGKPPSPKP